MAALAFDPKAWGFRRKLWLATALVVLVFCGLLFDTCWRAGELSALGSEPLDCRRVAGVTGPEDITYDRRREVAYVSATDARAFFMEAPAVGAIYRYTPGADKPERLFDGAGKPFHPHGISLWSDSQGPDLLFAVNHETNQLHTIEVFEVSDAGLKLVDTLRDPLLVSPNDVVAVGRNELYVTNDHGRNRGPGQLVDDFLRRERAQVVHVRDKRFRVLADDLAYANGINARADGTAIYVSEITPRRLRVYARAPQTGDLTLSRSIELTFAPDNIELEQDGSLYVAGHPKQLTFIRHVLDPHVPSPSEVVRLQLEPQRAERIYLDPGTQLSASSVAAPLPGHLLIGSVFADYFLDCQTPRVH